MSPSFPANDFKDVSLIQAERGSDLARVLAARVSGANIQHNSDGNDVLFNVGAAGSKAMDSEGIVMVLSVRRPFEIIRHVVDSVVVFVGHLRESVRVWNEGERHSLVTSKISTGSVFVCETKPSVSILVDVGSKDPAMLGYRLALTHPSERNGSREASHSSVVAHFVDAFKARNWLPNLGHFIGSIAPTLVGRGAPKINSYFPGLRALEA